MRGASRRAGGCLAVLLLAAACAGDAGEVRVELRLARVGGGGDGLAACAPRDPVSSAVTATAETEIRTTALASRRADLSIDVDAGDTIEATRIPAVAEGEWLSAAPEVWIAEWRMDEVDASIRGAAERLAWCDVLISVRGVPRGSAELRPASGRLPAGRFASLDEVRLSFAGSRVVARELPRAEAAEMEAFWRGRAEATWRLIACDAELREELEAIEPEAFAVARKEAAIRGAADCKAPRAEEVDRVR